MIAIAGAKGGCGKTTTTLGLAGAFARAGVPTLVVDADRQLPNLHVTADVDREPTIAALDAETDVTAVAQQVPGEPEVGVLPAPKPSETIDFQATLERLGESDSVQVIVDCPSGAGPDVIEPLSVADRVVVVTTGTEQSVSTARTTVDVAERLKVSVAGAIANRCDVVPDGFESRVDVPVLGTIPDRESPLTDEETRRAYDDVASVLGAKGDVDGEEAEPEYREDRLEVGVDPIDRELGGGLPPGSVAALVADPASQSELLLHKLTTTRGTLYLSTERSEEVVRRAMESSIARVGNPTVRRLDGDDPIAEARELIADLPEGANLVVDPADALERADRSEYVEFLNALKETMLETGSVAVLHCLDGASDPEARAATEHFADAVFDLRAPDGASGSEHRLSIPKIRCDPATGEPIGLDVSEAVMPGAGSDAR